MALKYIYPYSRLLLMHARNLSRLTDLKSNARSFD